MSSATKVLIGVVVAVAIGVGAVVALSGGDSPSTTSASEGVTTTAASGSPTTAPTAATTTLAAASACSPVGQWRLDDAAFFAAVEAIAVEPSEFEYISGDYFVEFAAGGEYTGTRVAWRFRSTSPDGAIEVEVTGEHPGTWTLVGDMIEIIESEGTVDASMWLVEDGALVPLDIGTGSGFYPGFDGTGTVGCAGDTLVLDMETEDGVIAVLLEPVG